MQFYGPEQSAIHDERFGDLARDAAALVVGRLHAVSINSGLITDLGCGSGILAAALVAEGFEVAGVDLSPAMIELARAAAPVGTFSVGSVHDVEIAPSVAVTATGEVLQHATDPRAGLDALRVLAGRVFDALMPGGVCAFDVDETHVLCLYDPAGVTDVLADAGFAVEARTSYTATTPSTPAAGWAVFVGTKPTA